MAQESDFRNEMQPAPPRGAAATVKTPGPFQFATQRTNSMTFAIMQLSEKVEQTIFELFGKEQAEGPGAVDTEKTDAPQFEILSGSLDEHQLAINKLDARVRDLIERLV